MSDYRAGYHLAPLTQPAVESGRLTGGGHLKKKSNHHHHRSVERVDSFSPSPSPPLKSNERRKKRHQGGSINSRKRSATLSPCPERFTFSSPLILAMPPPHQKQQSLTPRQLRRLSAVECRSSPHYDYVAPRSSGRSYSPNTASPSIDDRSAAPSQRRNRDETSSRRRHNRLRKTNSEPNDVGHEQMDEHSKLIHMNNLLQTYLLKFGDGPRTTEQTQAWAMAASRAAGDGSSRCQFVTPGDEEATSDSDMIVTDIEELKEAAKSIESIMKRVKPPVINVDEFAYKPDGELKSVRNAHSTATERKHNDVNSERRSGITTRTAGQPRGVMQFLPSVKQSEFMSRNAYDTYLSNRNRVGYTPGLRHNTAFAGSFLHPTTSYSDIDVNSRRAEEVANAAQFRRKVSMPDHYFEYEIHPPQSSLRKAQISAQSAAADYALYNRDGGGLIGERPVDMCLPGSLEDTIRQRKNSAPNSRFSGIPRYGSFNAPVVLATQRKSLISRHMSEHEKPLTEAEIAQIGEIKGIESLAGFSRFGRLLRSLRTSRQGSPDNCPEEQTHISPASSESPLSSPVGLRPSYTMPNWPSNVQPLPAVPSAASMLTVPTMIDPSSMVVSSGGIGGHHHPTANEAQMLDADAYLWRRRSQGSLRKHEDTRTHIVKELFDTETSYVDNLKLVVHKYLRPLKRPELCQLIEPVLVEEIFYQIPEVLGHHELFIAALQSRLDNWDSRQKIGDIILNNFTKQCVIDTYTAFINNWKNAKRALRTACQTKTAFAKYLERCSREHKNKLTLDALLIMPVQRIPRYELLLKELLKHTSVDHPDHGLLLKAQKEIHELATKINYVEQEAGLSEQMQQRLREIEAIVDGLDDLVSPDRVFHRYDLVTVAAHSGNNKERCMFLLSDQLIVTSVKRKSGTLKKASHNVSSSAAHDFLENHKFLLLMKISLDDLEVAKNTLPMLTKAQEELSQIKDELRLLSKVTELTALLKTAHQGLDSEVESLEEDLRIRLLKKQEEMANNPVLVTLELLVTTEDGVETLTVRFGNADKRAAWEKCFNDANEALSLTLAKKPPPNFLKSVAITKTRAGLHFTCAAPTAGRTDQGYPNVWVCNSDECFGQVCVVGVSPEADISSTNGVCNSRVLCICAVPAPTMNWTDFLQTTAAVASQKHRTGSRRRPAFATNLLEVSTDSTDSYTKQLQTKTVGAQVAADTTEENSDLQNQHYLELDSDSSDNELSASSAPDDGVCVGKDDDASSASLAGSATQLEDAVPSSSVPPGTEPTKKSPLQQQQILHVEEELHNSTMWLGTEDGEIIVYNFNDNIRTKKYLMKIQHKAKILSMTYIDDRVFVTLSNGEFLYYERSQEDGWQWNLTLESGRSVTLDPQPTAPVCCLLPVTSRLWCSSQNRVYVISQNDLHREHVFQVNSDVDSRVAAMTTSGLGVWLAIEGSPLIKLYHVFTYDCLLEVNVSPTITKTLSGSDDIIRQHKLSCLRVTALLCVKELLWVGTSAGVLLTIALPHLVHNSTRLTQQPNINVSPVGHCGQCRFLISVDVHAAMSRTSSFNSADYARRRMSLNVAALQCGKIHVMSGGDGYENFQDAAIGDDDDEAVGRGDSANQLLLWQA